MQEFLQNNASTNKAEDGSMMTKSRTRRRSCRTRATKRCRGSVKGKAPNMTGQPKLIPETDSRAHKTFADGDWHLLTYAERMNNYIAQTLIADNSRDESRSPPQLKHVYSQSPPLAASVSQNVSSLDYDTKPQNVEKMSLGQASRLAFPCHDATTPGKRAIECGNMLSVRRRLFVDDAKQGAQSNLQANLDRTVNSNSTSSCQNGFHGLHRLFAPSLNGKSLGLVDHYKDGAIDHYEDGLLAIANAACLMSTGVSDDCCPNQSKVSEDQGQLVLSNCHSCALKNIAFVICGHDTEITSSCNFPHIFY